jgi:hypothetical protein
MGKNGWFVSDGALVMTGKNNSSAAKLKNKMKKSDRTTSFLSLHCILHQHTLCAKSLKMNHTMNSVIKSVNSVHEVPLTIVNL